MEKSSIPDIKGKSFLERYENSPHNEPKSFNGIS